MILPEPSNGVMVYDAQPGLAVPPIPLNCYSALTCPAYYRAVTFLTDNLTSLPRSILLNDAKPETPHPTQRLLRRRPNAYQNSTTFWKAFFFAAVHYNNGFARIERDSQTQQPIALHNFIPEDILPFRYTKDGYTGQYYAQFSTRKVYPADDIIHIVGLTYDGIRGLDGIILHANTLQRATTLDRFQTRYLAKGTRLTAVIETPGELTQPKRDALRAMITEQFQGETANDVLFLSGGAKLTNTTISPQQSQLAEQQSLSTKQISQITGVPPEFLFDRSEIKYVNAQDSGENLIRYCLRPWIEQIEDELSLKLLSDAEQDQGYAVKLDPVALLKGDPKTQTDIAIAKKAAGVTTANETRQELGMQTSTDPEADKLKLAGDTAPPKTATGPTGKADE